MTRYSAVAAILAASTAFVNPAAAETELTMYYPIAVGGSLTKVVDGIVADFMDENPDITVNAIYAETTTTRASRPWPHWPPVSPRNWR